MRAPPAAVRGDRTARWRLAPVLFALAACSASPAQEPVVPAPAPAAEPTWDFTAGSFVWLPRISGAGSTESTPESGIDLLGGFDAGVPLSFSARSPGGRFGVLGDGFYLRLKGEDGPLQTTTQALMFELGGGVALDEQGSWQAIAGLRYVEVDYDVSVGPLEGSASASWVDPWIGARGVLALDRNLSLELRGDVGGFGVGTDFTWQALIGLRERVGAAASMDLGYRAIGLLYEDSSLTYDVVFHGPIVGIRFAF